jgi:hypothetical protein
MEDSTWPDGAAAWETETTELWRNLVEGEPWQSDGTDWYKALDCPRCGHGMSVYKGTGLGLDAREVVAECNCSSAHAGPPTDEAKGCGQRAWVTAPPTGKGEDPT